MPSLRLLQHPVIAAVGIDDAILVLDRDDLILRGGNKQRGDFAPGGVSNAVDGLRNPSGD